MTRRWCFMLVLACGAPVRAQSLGDATLLAAPAAAIANGRVVTPAKERDLPVAGVVVTLHRVGSDTAGALDSIRTDAQGRYSLKYIRFGRDDAVYFAAAVYGGIAYFSEPLRGAKATGAEGEITVFDTVSRGVTLHLQGHHYVVSAPGPTGTRDVVEVFEISNDTTVTLVGRDSLTPVWSAPIPRAATNFAGGQGDVAPSAMARRADRVVMLAPFGPGVKQMSYSYSLAASDFPLIPVVESATSVLEVLLEERTARVRGGSLRSMDTVTTQGRTFKRFLAQDVASGETLRIEVADTSPDLRARVFFGVGLTMGIAMLAALVRASARPRTSFRHRNRNASSLANSTTILAALAALDSADESEASSSDATRYRAERANLKAELVAALVAEGA